jgi:hypothetical protein
MFHQYSLNPIFLEKLFRSSVLMIFLLLPVLSYCQQHNPFTGGSTLGVDLGLGGKYIMSANGVESDPFETSFGFSAGYEETFVGDELFRLGLGLDYQFNRDVEDAGKFGFMSLYIYATSRIASNILVVGRYGGASYYGDDDHTEFTATGYLKGGPYYSAGVQRIVDKNTAIDVSYHVNKGVYPFYISELISVSSFHSFLDDWIIIHEDIDVEYKRIRISLIRNF